MSDAQNLRLIYSVRDFQLALSAVTFFLEVDEAATYSKIELRRFRCYLDMAVIAYGRPFSRSPRLPPLTFEALDLAPTPAQIDLHKRLKVYRDKVVAHSDEELMRILVTSVSLSAEVVMPIFKYDEGLDFLSDRNLWVEWLRSLMHCLVEKVVLDAQTRKQPYTFKQDYLFPD
jgi:hypothetical protein